jgi:hypothetical protein
MTLKVWCADCEGGGVIGVGHNCPTCDGRGFTFVEAVQLPEGRVLVVPRKTWELAVCAYADLGGTTHDEFVEMWHDDCVPEDRWRGSAEEHWGHAEESLRAALAVLFGGTVRVASVVGEAENGVSAPGSEFEQHACFVEGAVPIRDGDEVAILEPFSVDFAESTDSGSPGKEAA